MTWWVIEAAFGDTIDAEELAAALVRETGQTVEQRDGLVIGYAASEPDATRAANAMVRQFGPEVELRTAAVEPVDWTTKWRDGFAVHEIGRLKVGPSWLLAPGTAAVVIDPESAFGTGEHGSTRGALRLLTDHVRVGDRVLDLGSGSGILSIAAAKLGAAFTLGIDLDPLVISVAEENARRNRVTRRVEFTEGDAAVLAPLAGPVDLVVSNILRIVNLSLLDPIHRALRPRGVAVFAGMETREADLFGEPLAEAGFDPLDEVTDDGWWSIAARRR